MNNQNLLSQIANIIAKFNYACLINNNRIEKYDYDFNIKMKKDNWIKKQDELTFELTLYFETKPCYEFKGRRDAYLHIYDIWKDTRKYVRYEAKSLYNKSEFLNENSYFEDYNKQCKEFIDDIMDLDNWTIAEYNENEDDIKWLEIDEINMDLPELENKFYNSVLA